MAAYLARAVLILPMTDATTAELFLLIRLLAAALLSGLLGWERERSGKSAGLRTHMLVGIASALFMALSEAILLRSPGGPDAIRIDLLRTVQAVATGVGFLGGGVIFVRRNEGNVKGLTTAASIWATSAIGLGAGAGLYVLSGGATLLLLAVLTVMKWFEPRPDPLQESE